MICQHGIRSKDQMPFLFGEGYANMTGKITAPVCGIDTGPQSGAGNFSRFELL
jgi:hypothetical protein